MLHPLAANFDSVADAYEDGRPAHPPAVIGALAAELGLGPGSRVLDLAAGTGKLTRALHGAGLDVIAVEPQQQLRAALAGHIGAERVLEGLAESIPLDDGSVDAVTVADAFHWFDQPAAMAEIRRVLRGGGSGGLALIFVGQDWRGAEWGEALGELIAELRSEHHPFFDGPPWQQVVAAQPGWGPLREIDVVAPAPASREQLLDYVTSFSYVAGMEAAERAGVLERVAEVIDSGPIPAELPVRFHVGLLPPA